MNRTDILVAAIEAVQQRNEKYGEPEDNFARIAVLWNAWLSIRKEPADPLTSFDVAHMLSLMKKARAAHDPCYIDSLVDDAGYVACSAECSNGGEKI